MKQIPDSFQSIENYPERTYHYPDGAFTLTDCIAVEVKPSSQGGHAHRVICRKSGSSVSTSVYVRPGWYAISWPVEGDLPNFTF